MTAAAETTPPARSAMSSPVFWRLRSQIERAARLILTEPIGIHIPSMRMVEESR